VYYCSCVLFWERDEGIQYHSTAATTALRQRQGTGERRRRGRGGRDGIFTDGTHRAASPANYLGYSSMCSLASLSEEAILMLFGSDEEEGEGEGLVMTLATSTRP